MQGDGLHLHPPTGELDFLSDLFQSLAAENDYFPDCFPITCDDMQDYQRSNEAKDSHSGGSKSQRQPNHHQRRRTQVACARCRKRKIKCTGDPGDGSACDSCKQSCAEAKSECKFNRVSSQVLNWFNISQDHNLLGPSCQGAPSTAVDTCHGGLHAYDLALASTNEDGNDKRLQYPPSFSFPPPPLPLDDRTGSISQIPTHQYTQGAPTLSTRHNLDLPASCASSACPAPLGPPHTSAMCLTMNGPVATPLHYACPGSALPYNGPNVDRQLPAPSAHRPFGRYVPEPTRYGESCPWSGVIASQPNCHHASFTASHGGLPSAAVMSVNDRDALQQDFPYPVSCSTTSSDCLSALAYTSATPPLCSFSSEDSVSSDFGPIHAGCVREISTSSYNPPQRAAQVPIYPDSFNIDSNNLPYVLSTSSAANQTHVSLPPTSRCSTLANREQFVPLNESPSMQQ